LGLVLCPPLPAYPEQYTPIPSPKKPSSFLHQPLPHFKVVDLEKLGKSSYQH
jgi:hypothetical protein